MKTINLTIKILNKNEKYEFKDIIFEETVLRELGNNKYEVIKDRYGYFEGSKRKDRK
jgi:hypothetical protein